MIDEVHSQFRRWASWVLEPVGGIGLGLGKNIMQKLVEGKGEFLPGGSSRVIRNDPVANDVEEWLKTVSRNERFILKVFYLDQFKTNEEKAQRLKMSTRTLYDRIDKSHRKYQQWKNLRDNSKNL